MKCLEGIRVIELSTFVAAAAAGRLFAEQGADVIKVERLKGDDWRVYFATSVTQWDIDENPIWEMFNTNKRTVALNLKDPAGKEAFYALLRTADVMLTNYRPNALKGLGFDYDSVKEVNPRLVYGMLTSYGQEGPDCDDPGYDAVAFWARSGFMQDLVPPGDYPITTPGAVGDTVAGSTLFGGVCSALLAREKTGRGDLVEVSLYGSAIWILATMATVTQDIYGTPYPRPRNAGNPFVSCFLSRDGQWFNVTVATNFAETMQKFFTAMDAPEYIGSSLFSSMPEANRHKPEVYDILDRIYARFDFAEIERRLTELGIPCTRLRHFKEMHTDPQALANGYFVPFTYESGRSFQMPCPPIRYRNAELAPVERGGHVGEHTEEVLREIGYSEEKLEQLRWEKVIK